MLTKIEMVLSELLTSDEVDTEGEDNRLYRAQISTLRKEGVIFIPVGDFIYRRIEKCTQEEREKFINTQIASLRTNYFNTVKSIKNYMTDEQLKKLHEGGLFE